MQHQYIPEQRDDTHTLVWKADVSIMPIPQHTHIHKTNKRKCAYQTRQQIMQGFRHSLCLSSVETHTQRQEREASSKAHLKEHTTATLAHPPPPTLPIYIFKGHPLTFHSHRPVCDLLLSAHALKNTALFHQQPRGEERRGEERRGEERRGEERRGEERRGEERRGECKKIQNEERGKKMTWDDMKWKRKQDKKRTDNTKREDKMRETTKSTCDERWKDLEEKEWIFCVYAKERPKSGVNHSNSSTLKSTLQFFLKHHTLSKQ